MGNAGFDVVQYRFSFYVKFKLSAVAPREEIAIRKQQRIFKKQKKQMYFMITIYIAPINEAVIHVEDMEGPVPRQALLGLKFLFGVGLSMKGFQ